MKNEPVESTLLALQRATHATLHVLGAELAELALTPSELNALANLAGRGGQTISELGAAVGARATTLTSVLDRLQRRGYITRGGRPTDRRVVVVELTPTGRRVAATVRRAFDDLERRALATLSDRAAAGLRAGLRALAEVAS